jgi:hypothetical protein
VLSAAIRTVGPRDPVDRPGEEEIAMALDVQVVFDCEDADKLADFWATALDYVVQPPPPGFDSWPAVFEANGWPVPPQGSVSAVVDPDGTGPRVFFHRVPEGKTVKNRVHLDVRAGDGRDAKVEQLVAAGGTVIGHGEEGPSTWVVMTDPEGNEFCVTS